MKKKYIIPAVQTIEMNPSELMVPNQMSNPEGPSNIVDLEFEEEEEDEMKKNYSKQNLWE